MNTHCHTKESWIVLFVKYVVLQKDGYRKHALFSISNMRRLSIQELGNIYVKKKMCKTLVSIVFSHLYITIAKLRLFKATKENLAQRHSKEQLSSKDPMCNPSANLPWDNENLYSSLDTNATHTKNVQFFHVRCRSAWFS